MSKPKSSKKVSKPVPEALATETPREAVVVTTAMTKAAAKAAKATKATPTSKKGKTPKEDMVVFAFRLTPAERDAIHRAAGPAKASKFIRALAIAAANNDKAQVELIMKGTIGAQAE